MDIFNLIMFIAWGILGLINIIFGFTNRLSYGVMWIVLMTQLLEGVIR